MYKGMSDLMYTKLILDAIDQLRKRKARPDADRISHFLNRRHGLEPTAVKAHLAKLVTKDIIIQVEYKGSTSYRNAAKWTRFRCTTTTTTSSSSSSYIEHSELSPRPMQTSSADSDERPYKSVSLRDIEHYLMTRDLNLETLKAKLGKDLGRIQDGKDIGHIQDVIDHARIQEIKDLGRIQEIKDLSRMHEVKDLGRIQEVKDLGHIQEVKDLGRIQETTPSKRDSPIDQVDTKRQLQLLNSIDDRCCDYCLLGVSTNMKGVPEKLLVCKKCGAKAHPSCLDYSEHMAMVLDSMAWVCTDCKTCALCHENFSGSESVTCDTCDRAYHKICHTPVIESKPIGKWSCYRCINLDNENCEIATECINIDSCDSFSSDVEAVIDSEFIAKGCLEDYPSIVPHADDWTTKEVEMFFRFIGYHSEAPVFREKDINGLSLLGMKRNDVLTGLSIKLGPALKIYDHIRRLQCEKTRFQVKDEDEDD